MELAVELGMMYPWATPDYLLNHMSLDQWIAYHKRGWEVKQTEAKVHWGVYGMLMNGKDEVSESHDISLEEFQRYYPDAYLKDGKIVIPR